MPVGRAGQYRELPRGLRDQQRYASGFGGLPGAVGGHPAELLLVQLDQHARGQQIAAGQQPVVLSPFITGPHVGRADQPRQPYGQTAVGAGVEAGEGAGQVGAQDHRRRHGDAGVEAEHGVADARNQGFANGRVLAGCLARGQDGGADGRCSRDREVREQLPAPHRVLPVISTSRLRHHRTWQTRGR
ncbi:hypothetical protein ACFVTP_31635 [Streptomyces celluloflavus]|uniref:hypothetical protein n=1 Tax=Streptomyces celluloflavus TaxID=58344 RepID=UPI0036D86BC0